MTIKTTISIASMTSAINTDCHEEEMRDGKRLQVHKQTRLCKFFAIGQCTRGSACAFAHGEEKLRQQPDFSKTRLCADFMEKGSCAEGDRCKFAHGKDELRPGSAAKIGRPAKAKPHSTCQEASSSSKPKVDAMAAQEVQAARNFQLKQSLHEQAALRLMMQSAAPVSPVGKVTTKAGKVPQPCGKVVNQGLNPLDFEKQQLQLSFSRQTTWEGVETESAAFSRNTSMANDDVTESAAIPGSTTPNPTVPTCGSPVSPIRELPELKDVMFQVKNTFIEVSSDSDASDGEQEFKEGLRRSRSAPLF
eukprot:symbB.v1.2.005746.t1/scaffold307.1/size232847/11